MGRGIILFGAGASCGSDTCDTPPLMGGLFDELCRYDPANWGAVPDAQALDFRNDFEAAMWRLLQADAPGADVLQRAMASYFFQFRPRPRSLYANLAGRIRNGGWDGALVTLNYERLLELAVRSAGTNLVVNPPQIASGEVELCLPHGCCHLFGQMQVVGNISIGGGIAFDSPGIRAVDDPGGYGQRIQSDRLPPVMSYIEPDKRNRTGVSFIKGQRKRFEALTSSASLIAIIGVSVRPRDAHIWDPLAQTPAKMIYCGGRCGAKEYTNWSKECRADRGDIVLQGCFQDEFETICREVGL